MENKIKKFFQAIGIIKKYKKIHTIDELLDLPNHVRNNYRKVHNVDLSELDLSKETNMFSGVLPGQFIKPQECTKERIVLDWTDSVIWPNSDKLPKGIKPKQILIDSKQTPEISNLHNQGFTGRNIKIAIIDQRLNTTHPEYAKRIKEYKVFGPWDKKGIDYHGSLVAGIAVGETTGVAPDANLYYFAAPVSEQQKDGSHILSRKYAMEALKQIIEFNKTHSEQEKIRFLSCSWGTKTDLYAKECEELFQECEQNGIKIIGGAYKHMGTYPFDLRYPNKTQAIGIPTDGKTTSFWQGGFKYTRQGGSSSTFPYIAGVLACACQGNEIFFTRPNWQEELTIILHRTAIESPNGGKMINPIGIRECVSEIAHEMKMNLIKQNGSQHE